MSIPFVLYDSTGRITTHGACPEEMLQLQAQEGLGLLQGYGTEATHWVNEGVLEERFQVPCELNGMMLSDVPIPSKLTVNNSMVFDTNEHDIELEFTHPGVYKVKIEHFPYLPVEFEVTV